MKKCNTSGLSFIEMVVTMAIMITLGSIGMMEMGKLQNYFLVEGAEEKLVRALQEAKKNILEGKSLCSRILLQSESISEGEQSVFFAVEHWNEPPGIRHFSCRNKEENGNNLSNTIESLRLEKKEDQFFAVLTLKDTLANNILAEVYDRQFHTLSFDLEDNLLQIPMDDNEEYMIKLFDGLHVYNLSNIQLHFFHANNGKLLENDPSVIRVATIQGKTQSQEIKQGNLEILYEAPYAKSSLSLFDGEENYLVKDISIQFVNANEAEGNTFLYNASLLEADQNSQKEMSNTCVFDEKKLQFSCLNSPHE